MKIAHRRNKSAAAQELLRPRAAAMIESMRDIGYSLEAAVADIIDNSITARAGSIDVRAGWTAQGEPWLAVIDDGEGMSAQELLEAMRPGGKNPTEARDRDDLGRFGLGLKTASFSQCRRLTVWTSDGTRTSARTWDLDVVAERDEWFILTPSDEELAELPCRRELPAHGTMVLWQKLDRLDLGESKPDADRALNERITTIREHLSLVFHRFLAGEKGRKALDIRINGRSVEPFDPFNEKHASTDILPKETIAIAGDQVTLQPFILPHHTKVTPEQYDRMAGSEGYLRSQGFYVYRGRRLIIHSTWFRLARQEELTKLARVRIDIPNSLDHLWHIDVRKSRAQPPEAVKRRMRTVLDKIRNSAKRPYTHRGTVIQRRNSVPVWQRREFNTKISYVIDPTHPLLEEFRADLPQVARARFDLLLKMIESTFPAPLFFHDMASAPTRNDLDTITTEQLVELAEILRAPLRDLPPSAFRKQLLAIEPFASHTEVVEAYIDQMEREVR